MRSPRETTGRSDDEMRAGGREREGERSLKT